MNNLSVRVKLAAAILLTCVVLGLVCGHTIWAQHFQSVSAPGRARVQTPPPLTTVTIPRAEDLFVPFLLVVPLHTVVTWHSEDPMPHLVATTAQRQLM